MYKCIVAFLLICGTHGAKDLRHVPLQEGGSTSNEEAGIEYRLPETINPSSYVIILTPDFEHFTFDGEVTINISPSSATSEIKLHYNIMNITERSLTKADTSKLPIKINDDSYDEVTNIYTLSLKDPLEEGGSYELNIKYKGYLLADMTGFYRTSYMTQKGETRWLASTQFEPTGARRAFPCFDEPQFKATFQISIIRDETRTSTSNEELEKTEEIDTEKKLHKDTYRVTPKMSTYLVAFIVSDFKKSELSDPKDTHKYAVWSNPDLAEDTAFALDISAKIIDHMEDYTGIPFELPKMELAAIPDFSAGAMENWGLVTYREKYVLVNHKNPSVLNEKMTGTVIAHEFAHQWFGDLVSPKWWDFTWLNEGFATYFEHFGMHAIKSEWHLDEQFVVDTFQNALAVDAVSSSHPITNKVLSPDEISSNFDNIEYDKAGSIIRSAEHFLTTPTFQKALQNYLKNREHSVAEADDLFKEFDDQVKIDNALEEGLSVIDILKSWTEKGGYPVITVTANEETKKYHVSQSRFLISGPATTDELWWVPLTYTTSSELDFTNTKPKEWLKNIKEVDVSITKSDDEWIIFNIQSTGFYRVLYDEANYRSLIEFLKSKDFKNIHSINRAQLIDDSLNLARAGLLEYPLALELTEYLAQETDYIPWASFFTGISFLNNRLIGTNLYGNFKTYLENLMEKLYEKYSDFKVLAEDSQTERLNRINILSWASNLDYKTSNTVAFTKLHLLAVGLTDADIHPDLRSVVYCYGIRQGADEDWDSMWTRYTTILDADEKSVILTALACSKDTDKLNHLLQLSIEENSGIRTQDSASVFSAVYSKPEGLDAALDFLDNNFDDIKQYYLAMNGLSSIISGIASRISTSDQQAKFAAFYAKHIDELGPVESTARNALSTIEHNLKWLDNNRGTFEQWFAKYPADTTSTPESSEKTNPTKTPSTATTISTTTDAASPVAASIPLMIGLMCIIIFLMD